MYAYVNVPFYKRRFDSSGIIPEDIKTTEDLLKIPCLTKNDIQKNLNELVIRSSASIALIKDSTGGSTGQPLIFYYTKSMNERREAARIRHNRWCGWDIGQKTGVLWGALETPDKKSRMRKRIRNRFINRSCLLNAYDINEEQLYQFALKMQAFKPTMILAYTHVLYLFAKYLERHNFDIRPKGLICSAETLTQDKRRVIESVFKCKLLNRYGSREVGLIASECQEQSGLHINAENVYLEIVKEGRHVRSGEIGEVIVTDLFNYAMPLIRYKIADVARASDRICSCGRGLPMIGSVEGRTTDFIITSEGKLIASAYFTRLFYSENGVKQFQLIQEKKNKIVIKIVKSDSFSLDRMQEIRKKILSHIASTNEMIIDIEYVDRIQKFSSGKYRYVISNVKNPFT